MSTERAISEPRMKYDRDVPATVPSEVSAVPATEPQAYPPAPSATACNALVPCRHSAHGCPVGVDVPAVARAIAGGDHEKAFVTVRAAHPFASTCGNGCYAPCESACRRRPFGAPVAIASLESYGAGFASPILASPDGPCTSRFEARSVAGAVGRSPKAAIAAPRSGRRVAIVGGGAAGLACAHDLAVLGHHSIVFDERAEPGGLMTGVIPAFRFPVASARAECAAVLALDVEFRAGEAVGDLRSLLGAGVDAVFIAVGASRPASELVESVQQHPDIFDAMDVLSSSVGPLGQTIVAGEGPLAIDVARTLARRSTDAQTDAAPSLQVVLTTSLDTIGIPPELLAACTREGIRVCHGWRVRRVHVDAESGLLCSIDIAAPNGSASQVLPCDRLVLAAPRVPTTSSFAGQVDVTRAGYIATDPTTMRTSMPNVWAGGACAFGHRSIAHAVADGKRAAWEIHASLTGTRLTTTFASVWIEANGRAKPDRGPADRRRALPLLDSPPADPFAPSTPRGAARAGEEAARCFDCARLPVVTGECTRCGRCVETCPTGALTTSEGRPVIAPEICDRCGACVDACPDEALAMLRAEWEERIAFS